ncbi:BtrH N-terminal domain-containing protein [Xenophilus arseniciresistens]|uniref:BtrH N-terminal domain-containing protein n=1 Tax=Xenophilus arseniciresistens TaxID=1283306 RepID=A0AAE3SYQ8_9BURK|nr:BtrH N-terminal domain-containing protein [Xenophilus arseniciresistens]MDA7416357.1 BtrH N-terminal domain-containing protein [Xenophilus arseniciresistens]
MSQTNTTTAAATPAFEHLHAAHCESGVMANMLRHHGVPMTESLAFGLASGLAFAYLPFVKLSGLPLISYRMPPRAIIKGLLAPLGARFRFQTFATPEAGQQRLDELLARGQSVGLQTSVYWLPYFPPDMRFHFNAHNLLVYGKEGDEYLISDPVFETPMRCSAADLARARFAKGALAPRGLMYWPEAIARKAPTPDAVLRAIRTNARRLRAPIPLIGVRGMRMLAGKLEKLPPGEPFTVAYIGHLVRMQEEIGTGGAGFRFIYAAFLQEAAQITGRDVLRSFSDRLTAIGDDWRAFALKAARMVKGREAVDPPALAALLRQQAAQEDAFFAELGRAAR